jgi:hypothetical protein
MAKDGTQPGREYGETPIPKVVQKIATPDSPKGATPIPKTLPPKGKSS